MPLSCWELLSLLQMVKIWVKFSITLIIVYLHDIVFAILWMSNWHVLCSRAALNSSSRAAGTCWKNLISLRFCFISIQARHRNSALVSQEAIASIIEGLFTPRSQSQYLWKGGNVIYWKLPTKRKLHNSVCISFPLCTVPVLWVKYSAPQPKLRLTRPFILN